ncbi:DUF551 domain-containing protein [Morganella morganii]|uniref:DUF551 domain-containing protein n=1 Tax=Morganella morganii TaxID=582 RepID=UPI00164CCDC4|nr:DUF551 domain-containing protein [Morganella morganii]MBC4013650.1 DUF551 domain-containing protein [Morganella morganii]
MEWIKFSERMPEVGQKILTYTPSEGEYMMGEYDEPDSVYIYVGGGVVGGYSQFTHWMPLSALPQPPEG